MTTLEQIRPIFGNILGVPPDEVTMETSRNQFANWDSWAHLQLVMELEAQFTCNFTMDETISITSVRDFMDLINLKITQR